MSEPVVSREDIPLKNGKISKKWYACDDDYFSGSKYINVAFGTLTVIITFALVIQIYYGDYQVVPHGSVASDSLECSKVGTSILKQGGNAIDAAIGTAFCLSVATPHLTGLDAEGVILIYNHKTKNNPVVIDFSHATVTSKNLPTLVMGLAYLHKNFGKLEWETLINPSVVLARKGVLVSKMLVQAITNSHAEDLFGRLEPGQFLIQKKLATRLEHIANISNPVLYSYLNQINETMLTVSIEKSKFRNYNIYTPHVNSIGPFLTEALQINDKLNFTKEDISKPDFIYHIAEIARHFYEKTSVNDVFHEGTISNVGVMDIDDTYVSLVTGMYQFFGSGKKTLLGYVEDIKNKGTLSTRIPILITDSQYICGKRMVFGVNNIATAIQIINSLIIGNENGTESIEAPRFHIGSNGTVGIEDYHLPSFNDEVLKYLEILTLKPYEVPEPYESSNIVEKLKDELSSHSDSRGGGIASRF